MRIIPRPRTHRAPPLPLTPLNTFNTPSKCTLDPPVAAGHRASIDVGGELLFWVLGTTHRKCYCKLRVTCGLLPLRESSQRLQIAHHIPSHEALGLSDDQETREQEFEKLVKVRPAVKRQGLQVRTGLRHGVVVNPEMAALHRPAHLRGHCVRSGRDGRVMHAIWIRLGPAEPLVTVSLQ